MLLFQARPRQFVVSSSLSRSDLGLRRLGWKPESREFGWRGRTEDRSQYDSRSAKEFGWQEKGEGKDLRSPPRTETEYSREKHVSYRHSLPRSTHKRDPGYNPVKLIRPGYITRRMADPATAETGQTRAPPSPSPIVEPPTKKPRIAPANRNVPKANVSKRRTKNRDPEPEPCSTEDVLWKDIVAVLGEEVVSNAIKEGKEHDAPESIKGSGWGRGEVLELSTVECVVKTLGSGGEGIAVLADETIPTWAIVIPKTLPGERVRAKVYRHARLHSFGDLIEVIETNQLMRDDSRIKCRYFGECAGCQYQMLDYETQLNLKQEVIIKAYKNYSHIPSEHLPAIQSTIPSPKQYGYRTKITPHFDKPPKAWQKKLANGDVAWPPEDPKDIEWLKIGFNKIGTKKTMDIEECPIATPIINRALKPVREYVQGNAYQYINGVSLIFRESLKVEQSKREKAKNHWDLAVTIALEEQHSADGKAEQPVPVDGGMAVDIAGSLDSGTSSTVESVSLGGVGTPSPEISQASKDKQEVTCVTSHNGTVRERAGSFLFDYQASSFFQNNNAVLMPLVDYVKSAIFPTGVPGTEGKAPENARTSTHLVDTYCGAGLFAITLSPYFETIAGIELSVESIRAATHNAELNSISSSKISFRAGDATEIFNTVLDFPRDQTTVVIDPPRKGCDQPFLEQLVRFGAQTVVYVSCNVHTQARDIGWILKETGTYEGRKGRYVLESIRGFDLFPQTAHVESVAVLRKVD